MSSFRCLICLISSALPFATVTASDREGVDAESISRVLQSTNRMDVLEKVKPREELWIQKGTRGGMEMDRLWILQSPASPNSSTKTYGTEKAERDAVEDYKKELLGMNEELSSLNAPERKDLTGKSSFWDIPAPGSQPSIPAAADLSKNATPQADFGTFGAKSKDALFKTGLENPWQKTSQPPPGGVGSIPASSFSPAGSGTALLSTPPASLGTTPASSRSISPVTALPAQASPAMQPVPRANSVAPLTPNKTAF